MSQNLPPILPAGDPYWQQRAIEAVSAFGPDLERVGIAQLLSWWRHADRLTFDQTRQVVAHFAASVEPAELETTQALPVLRMPMTGHRSHCTFCGAPVEWVPSTDRTESTWRYAPAPDRDPGPAPDPGHVRGVDPPTFGEIGGKP